MMLVIKLYPYLNASFRNELVFFKNELIPWLIKGEWQN